MPDASAPGAPDRRAARHGGGLAEVPVLVRGCRLVGAWAALLATAAGLLVLLGWALDVDPLKRLLPGLVAMNPATAICFCLAGGSLALRDFASEARPWPAAVVRIAGAGVVAIAASRLVAYATPFDIGLDRLLFGAQLAEETPVNRMAPNTAIGFLLTGAALLALKRPQRWTALAAEVLALAILFVALVALAGYIYRIPDLAQVSHFIPMALNTALAFAATSVALLVAEPQRGLSRILVMRGEGGRAARVLLPTALVLPLGLAWVGTWGYARGVFDTQTAVSTMVTVGTLLLCALIWWTAERLLRAESLRARVEQRETRLQHALRQRARQVEAANAELEAFSYSVSHDLRAPLRSITGFSQALLEDHAAALNEDGKNYLERVVRAGQRMGDLIDDLLRLSNVARAEMKRADVDLSALAGEIVAQLRATDPGRAVDVVIQPELRVNGDPQLLRIALDNLIANAWKYTGRSAGARIEVGGDGAGEDGAPVFFVRDTGAGFDMAYVNKLFTPFQRLHPDAEFHGSGIGLATVQRVIRRHGGRVWAEGAVGRGATFYFSLDPTPEVASA